MDRKIKILFIPIMIIIWVILLSSCAGTYSQLDWLEMNIKSDVKHKESILVTNIFNNVPTASGFTKTVEVVSNTKKKWVFKNAEGCEVEYITILDVEQVPRVMEASITSSKSFCDKELKFSSQVM